MHRCPPCINNVCLPLLADHILTDKDAFLHSAQSPHDQVTVHTSPQAAARPPTDAPADPARAAPSLSPVPPGDLQPPDSKQTSPARAAPDAARKPSAATPDGPLSIAQQALLMAQTSAVDPGRAAPSAAAPASGPDAATPGAARSRPPAPSPQAAAMRSQQLLSSSPPAHVPVRPVRPVTPQTRFALSPLCGMHSLVGADHPTYKTCPAAIGL